jgi:hypothetical protein
MGSRVLYNEALRLRSILTPGSPVWQEPVLE